MNAEQATRIIFKTETERGASFDDAVNACVEHLERQPHLDKYPRDLILGEVKRIIGNPEVNR